MDKQKLFDSFIEVMSKFAQIRAVVALRDGFIMTTPFTICGSVFLLIANLPIPGYGEFMASIFGNDWTAPFNAVAGGTFNVLALIVVVAITYKFVGNEGCDASMASILALSTLLILMPPSLVTENGQLVGDIIPKAWVGSNGVITAIIIAFFVSYVFCYCEKNNVGIKARFCTTRCSKSFYCVSTWYDIFYSSFCFIRTLSLSWSYYITRINF